MIESFHGKLASRLFESERPKGFPPELVEIARRKLKMLHAATDLKDLVAAPGNDLHKLKGKRRGQWAIRINDQFRICFLWVDGNADRVEVTDYH